VHVKPYHLLDTGVCGKSVIKPPDLRADPLLPVSLIIHTKKWLVITPRIKGERGESGLVAVVDVIRIR
jgi:hypothetical protein